MTATPHKSYRIERISDFQNVLEDRLTECLYEVCKCIIETRVLGRDGISTECVTWTDDGIDGMSGANLKVEGHPDEFIPNPKFPGDRT